MALLKEWYAVAYDEKANKGDIQRFWTRYFELEKGVYEQLLTNPDEEVKGSVKELAEKYNLSTLEMTGFLDGINDSLVEANPVEEMEEGRKNLEANNNTVDFIVSHCCATSTMKLIGKDDYKTDILTDYFEELRGKVNFKKWFFGHYHDNQNVTEKEILLYEKVIRIS